SAECISQCLHDGVHGEGYSHSPRRSEGALPQCCGVSSGAATVRKRAAPTAELPDEDAAIVVFRVPEHRRAERNHCLSPEHCSRPARFTGWAASLQTRPPRTWHASRGSLARPPPLRDRSSRLAARRDGPAPAVDDTEHSERVAHRACGAVLGDGAAFLLFSEPGKDVRRKIADYFIRAA